MCRKKYDKSNYYPAFLSMEVNVEESLDYICAFPHEERTEALFLHEYIHYLQDLTTIIGYARIGTIDDRIKFAALKAKQRNKLAIPIDLRDTYTFNIRSNTEDMNIALGDFHARDRYGNVVNAPIEQVDDFYLNDVLAYSIDTKKYMKKIEAIMQFSSGGSHFEYRVGEFAISESMAYLIEEAVYPNVLPKGEDCPYNVVSKLAEYKIGQHLDIESLVALCDVCLMYSIPGFVLNKMLEFLSEYNGKITPALIYLYGLGPQVNGLFANGRSYIGTLHEQNSIVRKQFGDMFNHDLWKPIRSVVDRVFVEAMLLRENRPTFFLDIVRGGKICSNWALKCVMKRLGCLSFKSKDDKLYLIRPEWCQLQNLDPDWFVSLREVYNVLFTRSAIQYIERFDSFQIGTECKLKEWCHESFCLRGRPDLTRQSMNCHESPWLNIHPNEVDDCSFARNWTAYGFKDTILVANKSYLRKHSH